MFNVEIDFRAAWVTLKTGKVLFTIIRVALSKAKNSLYG